MKMQLPTTLRAENGVTYSYKLHPNGHDVIIKRNGGYCVPQSRAWFEGTKVWDRAVTANATS